jgi:serine phosphatase RsbU (regulator of sigma subunit)/putative methionine-R-sulfoxide reductase with GAF domain
LSDVSIGRPDLGHRTMVPVLVAAALVGAISVADLIADRHVVLSSAVLLGPLLAAAFVGPVATAWIAASAAGAAVALGWANHDAGSARHAVSVAVVTVSGGMAVWIASRRTRPEDILAANRPDIELGERLALALEAGGMGTWRWDRATGEVETDRWLNRLFGDPPGGLPTTFEGWIGLLDADERARANDAMATAFAAGTSFRFPQRCVWPDGSDHWLEVVGEVLAGPDGMPAGALGVTMDVTPRRSGEAAERAARDRAEQVVASMARFHAVTDDALARLPLDELLAALPERLAQLLECDTVRILLLDEEHNELLVAASYGFIGRYRHVPVPVGQGYEGKIAAADEPVVVDDLASLDVVSPALRSEVRSAAGVPLRADRLVGVLDIGTRDWHTFGEEDVALLRLAGERVAQDIERSRRFELERTARERSDYLARVNQVLTRSMELDVLMKLVTQAAVPRLADWCSLVVLDPDVGVRTELAHADSEQLRWARELGRRYPYDPGALAGTAAVVRSGQPEFYPDITDRMIEAATTDEEARDILRRLRLRSSMVVPLRSGSEVLGALQLVRTDPGPRYTTADLRLAEDLADRIAAAVQNALLYQHERHIAETLQRSLLPAKLPAIPGADIAVRYSPAVGGVDVGGDFYDIADLGGDAWGLAVGDISGKGITAAALTGVARHTIRAAGRHGLPPADVLRWVHDALIDEAARSGGEFCTALYGRLERASGDDRRFLFRFSLGGHPAPVYVPAGGRPCLVGTHGSLLGVLPVPRLEESDLTLRPGDVLVMYTDGVTDLPGGSCLNDAELLDLVATNASGDAEAIAGQLEEALERRHAHATRRDDIALVVVRVADEA